jgi:hypothetical protein
MEWSYKRLEGGQPHMLPAGSYYIGDPLLALSEADVALFNTYTTFESGHYKSLTRGHLITDDCALDKTEFLANDGNIYHVESGTIGILSESLCCNVNEQGDINGGHFYTFLEPVEVVMSGGIFTFTTSNETLVIDTTWIDDDNGQYPFELDEEFDEAEARRPPGGSHSPEDMLCSAMGAMAMDI